MASEDPNCKECFENTSIEINKNEDGSYSVNEVLKSTLTSSKFEDGKIKTTETSISINSSYKISSDGELIENSNEINVSIKESTSELDVNTGEFRDPEVVFKDGGSHSSETFETPLSKTIQGSLSNKYPFFPLNDVSQKQSNIENSAYGASNYDNPFYRVSRGVRNGIVNDGNYKNISVKKSNFMYGSYEDYRRNVESTKPN
jgi:hypothetical protein